MNVKLGKYMLKLWSISLVFLLLGVAVVLRPQPMPVTEQAERAETLVISVATSARTVDPAFATDAASDRLLRFISYGLVILDESGQPTPAAAQVTPNSDFTSWHVSLRPNQTFHNGDDLTATWVKEFYTRLKNPDTGSPFATILTNLTNINVLSSTEFVMQLSQPNPYFWSALTIPLATPDGNGLAEYQLKQKDDTHIVLEKSNKPSKNTWKNIVLRTNNDPLTRMLQLKTGEVDVVYNDFPAEYLTYAQAQGYNVIQAPSYSYTYLGVNHRPTRATADKTLRTIINSSLNKKLLYQQFYNINKYNEPSIVTKTITNNDYYKFNSVANKHTKSEGYNLTLAISNNAQSRLIAQTIQKQLKSRNININITPMDWNTYYERLQKGEFDLYLLTWTGPFMADMYFRLFHSSQTPPNGLNRGFYRNQELDLALEQLMRASNNAKLVADIEKMKAENLIDIPLWSAPHSLVSKSYIKGCGISRDGGYRKLLSCYRIK